MKIALIGCSGYGGKYLRWMKQYTDFTRHRLCAVIDPFAAQSPFFEALQAADVPVYATLEDFYAVDNADLVAVCSPIQFHAEHCLCALAHGSNVLCEKPAAASAQEAYTVREGWLASGKLLAVGFQWSYSQTMRELKRDILSGRLGRAVSLKTIISWKRADSYYSSWKGREFDAHGRPVHDSIAMNAVAHYLHNCFFLLGPRMEEARCLQTLEGSVYRAREIETYDTCFLRGRFEGGCLFYLCASHAAEQTVNPRFEYRFEHAVVTYDENTDGIVTAQFDDGTVKQYGKPQSERELYEKIGAVIGCIEQGKEPVCGIDTALPTCWCVTRFAAACPPPPFPPSCSSERRSLPAYTCAVCWPSWRRALKPSACRRSWVRPGPCRPPWQS
jgi:predicted dehydrogenase